MSSIGLIGKQHNAHLDWLLNAWMRGSSPVCFLEGFPGTGKTTIARQLLEQAVNSKLTAVMITAPETAKDPTDDLLLDLAMELNSAGRNELAHAIENNRPLLDVLSTLVNDPILIIIDEFQRSMLGMRAMTLGGFAKVLSTLANRKWLKGRILLITNRLVERARWSESYVIRTLQGMAPDDGVELLEHFAQEGGRIDEMSDISPDRRRDIVKWLGGNARAIRLLVRNLAYESLDDLIGEQPESWEMRDREISAELVEDLERHLLEKTLRQLPDDYIIQLRRLSVLRKPFKRQAIERLFDDKLQYALFRETMVDRFLMEQHKGWFNVHPIAREIGLQRLALSPADLQQAHSFVAAYYTRHFEVSEIVGWGALGGHFVEARYHLTKADRTEDLRDMASRFQSYILSTLSATSPIPRNAEELDERIAVLAALLDTPGPKSLEYHLARLLRARNQRNDVRRALHHANRAKANSDNASSWLLCSELLTQMEQQDEAISVLKRGINEIPPNKALVGLYDRCARLLTQAGQREEAIRIVKQGIDRIPPDKALVILYDGLARLLAQTQEYGEAIAILRQGIKRVPADKALVDLYNRCADLLSQMGKHGDAVSMLKQGINRIPPDKALVVLYISCCELLVQNGRHREALALLKQGVARIPPSKNVVDVYYRYGELLAQRGQYSDAIATLKQGIARIPPNKGVSPIYLLCGELLFQAGQLEDATALLREGTARVPPDQGASLIYLHNVKSLLASHQSADAIEVLWDAIRVIPVHQRTSLVEFLLLLLGGLCDEQGLADIGQITGMQPEQSALAQTLLYQAQGRWRDAAQYAEQFRKAGRKYATLNTIEAFSWLCAGELEQALDAIPTALQGDRKQNHWLRAFIQIRLGNIEGAKQALVAYDQTYSSQDVDEGLLLTLWNQSSTTLRQCDLAHYFPTLPSDLTGLAHPVTRITYQHAPVLSTYLESKRTIHKDNQHSRVETASAVGPATAMAEKYVDFDLHIASDGHIIASSPEGQAISHISTQLPSSIRLSLQLIKRRQTDAELLKEVGNSLYEWLFPTAIHTHLQQTEAVARRDKAKLRLRIRIESAAIASLPLEFIYREGGGYFLAANPDTVVSRYLNSPLPPEGVRRREGPLHMLTIIADPIDQVRLDPDEWESIIEEAVAKPLTDNQMTLRTVKRATRKEIRNALLEQRPDIIQFVGHGIYQDGKGYLALVDDDTSNTWTVNDERFANLFMGYDDHLGLVVMATCESAQSDDPQSFLGIAPQLVQRGTPAVIAMQYSVYIKTAEVFLEEFYTAVAARKPIDWAVQSARNGVSLEFGLDNREFATPVLYMRARDGNVF